MHASLHYFHTSLRLWVKIKGEGSLTILPWELELCVLITLVTLKQQEQQTLVHKTVCLTSSTALQQTRHIFIDRYDFQQRQEQRQTTTAPQHPAILRFITAKLISAALTIAAVDGGVHAALRIFLQISRPRQASRQACRKSWAMSSTGIPWGA